MSISDDDEEDCSEMLNPPLNPHPDLVEESGQADGPHTLYVAHSRNILVAL